MNEKDMDKMDMEQTPQEETVKAEENPEVHEPGYCEFERVTDADRERYAAEDCG